MDKSIEVLFIGLIIAAQVYFFWTTWRKIQVLKTVFGLPVSYKISRVSLLEADLSSRPPLEILTQLPGFEKRASLEYDGVVNVGLLMPYNQNPVAGNIVHSINTYLLRNSGAAPDFNLIKDIAERNSDAVEEEINSTISIPLYLGLLGTLIGIIMGLSNVSGLSFEGDATGSNAVLDRAIPNLMGGVVTAMVASFTGLLLTIIHSGFFYKLAKAKNGSNKNAFFTFLQVDLLPLLNQNLNATLYSLQANLLTFNKEFGQNIQRLDVLMNRNYEAIVAQENMMDLLSKIDIMEFAAGNVKVLKELQKAIVSFGNFNEYVGAVNLAIQKTDSIVVRMNELLQRTDNFDDVMNHLLSTFSQNQDLMDFIRSHFDSLDSSRQLIGEAVIGVNEHLGRAIDDLKRFTEEKIASVRAMEINEVRLMQDEYPEKWKNLDELKKIGQILNTLTLTNAANAAQMQGITGALDEVRDAVHSLEEGIEVQVKMPSISKTVKGWFKKKKADGEA